MQADDRTKMIWVYMPIPLANEIEKRAAAMYLSTGNYCKVILIDWLEAGKKLELIEQ